MVAELTVGGLFSGIGGIERGLEQSGMSVLWHAESDDYCRRLLARHWPNTPCYASVELAQIYGKPVDLLCGGFPCQPISQAAARTERGDGWLWPVFARTIGILRPRWIVLENVEALRYANRGFSEVLSDLSDLGFDAEWRVIRASDFAAPHRRARLWLVAHSNAHSEPIGSVDDETPILSQPFPFISGWRAVPDLRVADGVSHRVLRRERLGNAVVPQIAAWVGRCILAHEGGRPE